MKKIAVIIVFCLFQVVAAYGSKNLDIDTRLEYNKCSDNLTFFCLFGNLNYPITQEFFVDFVGTPEIETGYRDETDQDVYRKLTLLTSWFPNAEILPRAEKELYADVFLQINAVPIIFKQKLKNIAQVPLKTNFYHFPFHESRHEGFGIRLRI